MNALNVIDAELGILALYYEIRRTEALRYDHRGHGVLLVARSMSCKQAAGALQVILGRSPFID